MFRLFSTLSAAALLLLASASPFVSSQGLDESGGTLAFLNPAVMNLEFVMSQSQPNLVPLTGSTAPFPVLLSTKPLCDVNVTYVLTGDSAITQYLTFAESEVNYSNIKAVATNSIGIVSPFCFNGQNNGQNICDINKLTGGPKSYVVTLACAQPTYQCYAPPVAGVTLPLSGIGGTLQTITCQASTITVNVPAMIVVP